MTKLSPEVLKVLSLMGLHDLPRPAEMRRKLRDAELLVEHSPYHVPDWIERRRQMRLLTVLSETIYKDIDDEPMES